MEKVQKQVTQPMSYSEFTAQCDRLEREMRKELAPIEAKYWQAVVKTNLLHKEMEPLYEAYRAAWETNVVPHRRVINNISNTGGWKRCRIASQTIRCYPLRGEGNKPLTKILQRKEVIQCKIQGTLPVGTFMGGRQGELPPGTFCGGRQGKLPPGTWC